MKKHTILLALIVIFFLGCTHTQKFDREKWINSTEENFYSTRKEMIADLLKRNDFAGRKYSDLIKVLGNPANYTDENSGAVYYPIDIHYGGIDPDYEKDLIFYLNKDSVIISYKLTEWGHKTFHLF